MLDVKTGYTTTTTKLPSQTYIQLYRTNINFHTNEALLAKFELSIWLP